MKVRRGRGLQMEGEGDRVRKWEGRRVKGGDLGKDWYRVETGREKGEGE